MTQIWIVAALVLFNAASALAAECRLERPIPFSGSILNERYFGRVTVDQTPKFLRPENYDPSNDDLGMVLFHMGINGGASGLLGAKLGVAGGSEFVGFSNSYSGPTAMEGETETVDGTQVYWSRVSFDYPDVPGVRAVHELRVGVRGSSIVSIVFTHPVFEITEINGPYTYTRFTGENQTLCVRSAR